MSGLVLYVVVASFGAAVGIGELVARYRDAPEQAILTFPALLYIGINAAAACAALYIIEVNNWTFGAPDDQAAPIRQALVAGFGAMAFFRSALFTVRVGDNDIQVGPSAFLTIIMSAADRAVDRERAESRARAVGRIMKDVSFAKAEDALTSNCLALMQNLSSDDITQINQALEGIATSGTSDQVKSLNLGLLLMNFVGEDVLDEAVKALGDQIKADKVADTSATPTQS